MNKNPAKDFGPIADDYAFFREHSTEGERDAQAYMRQLAGVVPTEGPIRFLDFGCGSGSFTAQLLDQTGWPPTRLRLTLVEPVESSRQQAVVRLARHTEHPVADSAALPRNVRATFDVVLANHVLYYVSELRNQLAGLIGALSPSGVFLIAIAGKANALIEFWKVGFSSLGREIPYNLAEDAEAALRELKAEYQRQQVAYEVTFPDSEENRMRILRFLLAEHLAQMANRPLLDLFDQYAHSGRINIRTVSDHFTIRSKSRGR